MYTGTQVSYFHLPPGVYLRLIMKLSKCLFNGGFYSRKYGVSVNANATDSMAQSTEVEQLVVSQRY